jgi:hypothetical protein
MASTQSTILTAVKTVIQSLSLSGCEEVAIRAEPKDRDTFYPGITISPVAEVELAGTNELDDIGYGVLVTMVVNNDCDPTEDDLFGDWRQKIRKKFIHQKLSGVASVHTCLVQPGPIYETKPKNLDVGSLVIRVISRETRV